MTAPAATRAQLPRTVVVLGWVSLLNDAASEMITPLLPVFLTATLGAGPAIVGLVEGVAEATASVLKLLAGRLVDRGAGAKRLVFAGYGLANLARPALGLAALWPVVLLLRFADRVGKGVRTAPRDALIAGAAGAAIRGRAFGFHRSMDHAGAVVGPLVAFALLSGGAALGRVFLWSALPGVLVLVLLGFGVPADAPLAPAAAPAPLRWRALDARLRALLIAAAVLALATVPEVFVVLWARESGLPLDRVPLVWAGASLAKMLLAYPAGVATDRYGRVPLLLAGWTLRVLALAALAAVAARGAAIWALFLGYSATLALTEPAERSLIGDVAPPAVRGTAFGLYHLASGLLVLPGAVLFGLVWERAGSGVAFGLAAVITALAALGMALAARTAARHLAREP
ncbi:MAG TPA: MFS transporter [Steroidobacteraceae bacterium]|nr:MFS transporter [Steroidobacteraceae bacterium]